MEGRAKYAILRTKQVQRVYSSLIRLKKKLKTASVSESRILNTLVPVFNRKLKERQVLLLRLPRVQRRMRETKISSQSLNMLSKTLTVSICMPLISSVCHSTTLQARIFSRMLPAQTRRLKKSLKTLLSSLKNLMEMPLTTSA